MQQRVVREIDSRHNMAGVKSDLFSLGKEVVGIAVQRQLADPPHRNDFFRNNLGGIEQVKSKLVLVLLLDDLNAEFPFGKIAVLDRFPEIAAMKVRILPEIFCASSQTTECTPSSGFQ